MESQLNAILQFIWSSFLSIWPYLLITIPLAVAVQVSGASKYIKKAFAAQPFLAILLATLVGAFSPFCSCSVIPMVAALLIGGVPLAPVMSFWIASPSMDPEAFFLSASMIGWELAVWRLGTTLVLSLGSGFATHFLVEWGWLGEDLLKTRRTPEVKSWREILGGAWQGFRQHVNDLLSTAPVTNLFRSQEPCCETGPAAGAPLSLVRIQALLNAGPAWETGSDLPESAGATCSTGTCSISPAAGSASAGQEPFRKRLLHETFSAVTMVVKFMALAFFLEALIHFYVPESWIISILGRQNPLAIVTAALLGVPVYTSNLTALPLIGGLLDQGMNPAAGLAFLIAGPTTTLPAMAAVWNLVNRRVFATYLAFTLIGAVLAGTLFSIFG